MDIVFYSVRPEEKSFFSSIASQKQVRILLLADHLDATSVQKAKGAKVVSLFVHDKLSAPILQSLKEQGVELLILRCRGFDNVDQEAAKRLGLKVQNIDYGPDSIIEHTLALIFASARRLKTVFTQEQSHNFELANLVGISLRNKCAGIIGTGAIGAGVACALQSLGMQVLAHDPIVSVDLLKRGIEYTALPQLISQSDVISLHCPLREGSGYVLGAAELKQLPHGAIVVNTGRGGLLDTRAAFERLSSGHLGALALDVYENENDYFYEKLSSDPLPDNLLEAMLADPKVIITPHQAFLSEVSLAKITKEVFDIFERYNTN